MIDLVLSNGQVFVWSADDWLKLRQEHRIVSTLVGCLPKLPRQEILHGLPVLLQSEEVTFLLEKKIARLVEIQNLQDKPNDELIKKFEDYREKIFREQEEYLREGRKKQIIKFMDRIVEGKRRKILGLKSSKKQMRKPVDNSTRKNIESVEIDREALLAEEVSKIPQLEKSEVLIQTHTAHPWTDSADINEVEWNYPQSLVDKLKYRVFKDLWEKGFYVTNGDKFGGDFVAYPGDPVMFHSLFVVTCKDADEEIPALELSGQCRVAGCIRKTQVYAYILDEDTVSSEIMYQSFIYEPKDKGIQT